jgi:hypothetical protein
MFFLPPPVAIDRRALRYTMGGKATRRKTADYIRKSGFTEA